MWNGWPLRSDFRYGIWEFWSFHPFISPPRSSDFSLGSSADGVSSIHHERRVTRIHYIHYQSLNLKVLTRYTPFLCKREGMLSKNNNKTVKSFWNEFPHLLQVFVTEWCTGMYVYMIFMYVYAYSLSYPYTYVDIHHIHAHVICLYCIYIYICRYYEKWTPFEHDLYIRIIELDHCFQPKFTPRCLKYSHCFRECSSQKHFQASPKRIHHKPFESKLGCQFWHHKIWHAI